MQNEWKQKSSTRPWPSSNFFLHTPEEHLAKSGQTDWMSLGDWVVALRNLHAQARQGKLSPEEMRRYRDERETLSRAVLAAQRLRASPQAKERQSLRVARELPVELTSEGGAPMQTTTIDVGAGGLSVMLERPLRAGQTVKFALELERGVVVAGGAKVVSVQRKGKPYRVAVRFENLAPEAFEKIDLAVFEAALAGINPGA
jgi:hypothetical protein